MRREGGAPFARKRFGQHFLEPAWVRKLVDVVATGPDEAIVEIGPGRGALTRPLTERAGRVVGVELDRDLAHHLRETSPDNFSLVEGDFLDDGTWPAVAELLQSHRGVVRVVGNLPYNVASPILIKLLDLWTNGAPFVDATVMLQREVADRLLAKPGTREYGALSVTVQHRAEVTRLLNLPAGAFRPPPKVLSSVVRLRFHAPDPAVADARMFDALVRSAFTHRRKTIANVLKHFGRSGAAVPDWLEPARRPETLSVADFAHLANDLTAAAPAVL